MTWSNQGSDWLSGQEWTTDIKCFPILAIVINDAMNIGVQISPWDTDLIPIQYSYVHLHINL